MKLIKLFTRFAFRKFPLIYDFFLINLYYRIIWKPDRPSIQDLINTYSKRKEKVFFIQIGSNDGFYLDPIYKYIKRDKWQGVLVEPVSEIYKKLKKNYRRKDLIYENSAISETDGEKDFYRLTKKKDYFPAWYNQLGSFSKELILTHKKMIPDIEDYLISEKVNCITFNSLIKKHNVKKVDLIHIDTEGFDFEVIKMIDFDTIKPDVIMFEHKHLSTEDFESSKLYLKERGYSLFVEEIGDTIAMINEQ